MKHILLFFSLLATLGADGPGVVEARKAAKDEPLTTNPKSAFWAKAKPVTMTGDQMGQSVPGHETTILTRWTQDALYFLFVCPYETLNLKSDPDAKNETNKLWTWDVAEVFIGSDFQNINHYKEFQVSPQGEWVDLDIDRDHALPEGGWKWNSGFTVKASLDQGKKVWTGAMRIPWSSIDKRAPQPGNELRLNVYRIQGPEPRKFMAWQPTNNRNNHTPEAFGRIKLVP